MPKKITGKKAARKTTSPRLAAYRNRPKREHATFLRLGDEELAALGRMPTTDPTATFIRKVMLNFMADAERFLATQEKRVAYVESLLARAAGEKDERSMGKLTERRQREIDTLELMRLRIGRGERYPLDAYAVMGHSFEESVLRDLDGLIHEGVNMPPRWWRPQEKRLEQATRNVERARLAREEKADEKKGR